MTVSHQRSPSIGPVRSLSPYPASPYFYHPFFSFLYLIAALFMPGPANKHMNARAFSGAHTTRPWDPDSRPRTQRCKPHTLARQSFPPATHRRRSTPTVADGPRALSRLINSQRDDISRLFSLDPFSVPIAAETPERIPRHLGITCHRGLRMRGRIHANARPRLSCFSFLLFFRFILLLNLLLPFYFPSVSTPLW